MLKPKREPVIDAHNVDPKTIHELADNLEDVQRGGTGRYASVARNKRGKPAVHFDGQIMIACNNEDEANALAAKLNDVLGPIIAPFRERYIAELHAKTRE